MIARELARYRLHVEVLEKEAEVSFGCTKASNSIIHADAGPLGSNTSRFTARSHRLFDQLCDELAVPFERPGELFVAFDEDELGWFEQLVDTAPKKDLEVISLTRDQVLDLEPAVSPDVLAGVLAPAGGLLYSFELTIALFENAVQNGVHFRFDTQVIGARQVPGCTPAHGCIELHTSTGPVRAGYVVNATGVRAGDVARMLGDDSFESWGERGERMVLDQRCNGLVTHVVDRSNIAAVIAPTLHGNVFLGRWDAQNERGNEETVTTSDGMEGILREAQRVIPAIERKDMIRAFSGVWAVNSRGDQIVEASPNCSRLVNVCLTPPGVTIAPAVAEEVIGILDEMGLELKLKEDFQPRRVPIPDFSEMTDAERAGIIEGDPRYGRIVCRCETVTEGEIVEAIRRGARTLDGVKYRVRAGMGRCQGGFCGPRVMNILARELGLDLAKVTKAGGDSWLSKPRT
jgi:glycerol-3-phosphate dehydrogenase